MDVLIEIVEEYRKREEGPSQCGARKAQVGAIPRHRQSGSGCRGTNLGVQIIRNSSVFANTQRKDSKVVGNPGCVKRK